MARTELRSHPKFKRLVRRLNLPAPYVIGLLQTMWFTGYDSRSSLIGDADDVELAAEWPGKKGEWFNAIQADWLDEVDGRYHIHDLADHAPEYVKKRLARSSDNCLGEQTAAERQTLEAERHMTQPNPTQEIAADAARSKASQENPKPPIPRSSQPTEPTPRIGEKPPKSERKSSAGKQPTGAHAELIAHFCELWKRRYGADYPFRGGRDGTHFSAVLKRFGSLERATAALEKFFASTDDFYARDKHSPGMFVSQLRKFIPTINGAAVKAKAAIDANISKLEKSIAEEEKHLADVARVMDNATKGGLVPGLLAKFKAEFPVFSNPIFKREIDPATNAAFREWCWQGVQVKA